MTTPEQTLWRGVVRQAIRDALDFYPDALRWLLTDTPDLAIVLERAEMDIEPIRRHVRRAVPLHVAVARQGLTPARDVGAKPSAPRWKRASGKDFQQRLIRFDRSPEYRALREEVGEPSFEVAHACLDRAVAAYRSAL